MLAQTASQRGPMRIQQGFLKLIDMSNQYNSRSLFSCFLLLYIVLFSCVCTLAHRLRDLTRLQARSLQYIEVESFLEEKEKGILPIVPFQATFCTPFRRTKLYGGLLRLKEEALTPAVWIPITRMRGAITRLSCDLLQRLSSLQVTAPHRDCTQGVMTTFHVSQPQHKRFKGLCH